MNKKLIIIGLIILIIASCTKQQNNRRTVTNQGRYALKNDLAPDASDFDITTLEQWKVQPERKSKYGNHSPYIVFGKTYYLADTDKSFEQRGTASWYGKKFHGHTTSNMEIFDMYKLTAAHRTLPLPSYVEVTNLDNNKKVVVRVNDRGPFKSKRIIDLSWAGAKALNYDKKGLANVHIKLIQASGVNAKPIQQAIEYKTNHNIDGLKYLQIGAFSQKPKALDIAMEISTLIFLPVHVTNTIADTPLYRVRIGPLSENENIIDIIQKVHAQGFNNTKMVVE